MAGLPPPPVLPKPEGLIVKLWNYLFSISPTAAGADAQKSSWFIALVSPWSLPMRIAVFVAVSLTGVVGFCLWGYYRDPFHVPWRHSLTVYHLSAILLLLMVISVSLYQALKYWLNVENSAYPDINSSWQAGIEALRKQGLSLGDKPLFLVLGSTGQDQERVLFESSNSAFLISGVPDGPAPLHWYVNADRIFLSCTEVGWLSALTVLIARRDTQLKRADIDPFSARSVDPQPRVAKAYSTMTNLELSDPTSGAQGPLPSTGGNPYQTISFWDMEKNDDQAELIAETLPSPAVAQEQPLAIIPPSDAAEQEDRLEAVGELLWNARYPYSPINGCITLIPFTIAGAKVEEADEMAKGINTDLKTLHKTLRVKYPVTAIFTGMESEPGFRELMRRVGPDRCSTKRFGMGYDLRSPANSTEIGAFTAYVCGVFEEWVYGLFREDQALKRPGNSSLFSLLCRVRSSFQDRLSILLTQGFGYNERLDPDEASFFFSGCYFVASGRSQDKRAFIEGICDKLDGQQDQLEWSLDALKIARRSRMLMSAAIGSIVLLIAWLVYMVGH
jgi:hypothetical protein